MRLSGTARRSSDRRLVHARSASDPALVAIALAVFCLELPGGAVETPEKNSDPRGRVAEGVTAGWSRHTIDRSSKGADGVRLLDVDRDGDLDIVTGWEEGGVVRAYLHPGAGSGELVRPWPRVEVGRAASVEDAVFVDLDADRSVDVVSSSEGEHRRLIVHWAPVASSGDAEAQTSRWSDARAWQSQAIPTTVDRMAFMFCVPLQVDGRRGIDLVAGGKGAGAQLGWLESPENPRDLSAWTWHALRPLGWAMTIDAADMDGDGDRDLLLTDRRGERRGAWWMEHPGDSAVRRGEAWKEHAIGAVGREVMFAQRGDVDGDGLEDVVLAVKPRELVICRRLDRKARRFEERVVHLPDGVGRAKGVGTGDIDLDGCADLVFSCESARGELSGLRWMRRRGDGWKEWTDHEIGGAAGVKFDLVELLDIDGDGDLDVLTCEERDQLGVCWYENPRRSTARDTKTDRNQR